MVIFRITSAQLAAPVVAETDLVHLLAIAGDVVLGRHFRMLSCLDSVLFGGQSISVVTHGMQHVKAVQPFIA